MSQGPFLGSGGFFGGTANQFGPRGPYGPYPGCGCSGCLFILVGILLIIGGCLRLVNF